MRRSGLFLICFVPFLYSCEFSCSVGDKQEAETVEPFHKRILNEISLQPDGVKVDKAYLLFENGEPVPDANIVDFTQPVKLVLVIDKGWKEVDGKVRLGASEKIETYDGTVLLDEKDLFAGTMDDGISPRDAKTIALTATIRLKQEVKPLTTFIVSFMVWDKQGKGFVQGSYKLYAQPNTLKDSPQ